MSASSSSDAWRVATTNMIVDDISGTRWAVTTVLKWRAKGDLIPEGEDGRVIKLIRNPDYTLALPAAQSGACLTGQCPPAWPNPLTTYAVAAVIWPGAAFSTSSATAATDSLTDGQSAADHLLVNSAAVREGLRNCQE